MLKQDGTISNSHNSKQIRIELLSPTPDTTHQIGLALGENSIPGDIFLLTGPLGAGKTCLTQGIAWGLGFEGYARSPTFVISTQYKGRIKINHIDLFRLSNIDEVWNIGLEDILSDNDICVVEWPERAYAAFPNESHHISLRHVTGGKGRLITLEIMGQALPRFYKSLSSLKEITFKLYENK